LKLGLDGTFSGDIKLNSGLNSVSVVVENALGRKTERVISVIYNPTRFTEEVNKVEEGIVVGDVDDERGDSGAEIKESPTVKNSPDTLEVSR